MLTATQIFGNAQATLLTQHVIYAWRHVAAVIRREPTVVLQRIHGTGVAGSGPLPTHQQLLMACRHAVARCEQGAAAARSLTDLPLTAADTLALWARQDNHRRKSAPPTVAGALAAAMSAWAAQQRQQQLRSASRQTMDQLRRQKAS